jgi:hypothetical protein
MLKSMCAMAVAASLGLGVWTASATASPVARVGQVTAPSSAIEVTSRRNHNWYGGPCLPGDCRAEYRHRHPYNYDEPWLTAPFFIGDRFVEYYYDDEYYGNHRGSAHVEWCSDRYRSYRPSTNTWTSYSGRIRRCISPYS